MAGFKVIKRKKKKWEEKLLNRELFSYASTSYGEPLDIVYTPEESDPANYLRKLGFPGFAPFIRGVQPSMYRGHTWVIHEYISAEDHREINKHLKHLIGQGEFEPGIIFSHELRTSRERAEQENHRNATVSGVVIHTLKDMEEMFDGIPLDQISPFFIAGPTAAILLAMYLSIAEAQGLDPKKLSGRIQNDILTDYLLGGAEILPFAAAIKLTGDIIEYCIQHVPKLHTICINGDHFRGAGCDIIEEVTFSILNALTYIEAIMKRGLTIDEFGHHIVFNFGCGLNFFEEIAKFRAARRSWQNILKERFKSNNPETMKMKIYTSFSGYQEAKAGSPEHVTRGTVMTLISLLSGCQGAHLPMLESPSLTRRAKTERTQRALSKNTILEETALTAVADPMGGAFFLEHLTDQIEKMVEKKMKEVEKMGGIMKGIKAGLIQSLSSTPAHKERSNISRRKQRAPSKQSHHSSKRTKIKRENTLVRESLNEISRVNRLGGNLIGPIITAVQEYATVEEIICVLKESYGDN